MHLCIGTTPTVQLTMIFDCVIPDEVNRAKTVLRHASGKSINVARVLHVLGENVRACLPVGADTGQFLRNDLTAAGLKLTCIDIASPTRTCVTMIDRAATTVTELVEEHPPISSAEYAKFLETSCALIDDASFLTLSGSLAKGVPVDFYARCCERATKARVPVILDARDQPLALALEYQPLVVKPNRAELAATTGIRIDDDVSLKNAMVELHHRGAQWVIVTMGSQGAVASDGKQFWKIPAIKVDVISPIGSGDSFAAGLAAGISRGQEIPRACSLATACAAANCLIAGSGLLRIEDVRRFEPAVRVEKF